MRTLLYGAAVAAVAFGVSMWVLPRPGGELAADAALSMQSNVVSEQTSASGDKPSEMAHSHPLREVAAERPVPSVTHLVFPDAMDGYNIQIMTENFTFTPAAINTAPLANEGHAHLYINGAKISRIYGKWVHVPASALTSGANAVSITLNANDHSEWAVNGAPISSTVIIYKPDPTDKGE